MTDVDGTISRMASTPQAARVSPLCHHQLTALCDKLALVAAVSGRSAVDVKDMVGIEGMVYIGNHGMERWHWGRSEFTTEAREYLGVIESVIKELTPLLSIEGVSIENKKVTATIHYRLCRDHQSARRRILTVIKNAQHARSLRVMQEGKYAVNLLPPVAGDKGTGVLALIEEYHLQGGIYLGDDVTDIDAFRAIHSVTHNRGFRGLAIGIVASEMPETLIAEADFTLNEVDDVERFLEWLNQAAVA